MFLKYIPLKLMFVVLWHFGINLSVEGTTSRVFTSDKFHFSNGWSVYFLSPFCHSLMFSSKNMLTSIVAAFLLFIIIIILCSCCRRHRHCRHQYYYSHMGNDETADTLDFFPPLPWTSRSPSFQHGYITEPILERTHLTLKMKVACSSEVPVPAYKTTRCHCP